MTDAAPGGDPDRIIKTVAVGSYLLEIGPQAGASISTACDEPAEAAEEGSRLSRAIARESKDDKKPRDAVSDLELANEDAGRVTDQVQQGVALWTEVATGRVGVSAVNNEIDALLAVLLKLDRSGRFDEQLRLARALSGLLAVALRWLDLLRSLRELLAAAERHGDKHAKAWALHELGTLHLAAGKLVEADRALGEAREVRRELGDSRGLAATEHNLHVLCQALRQLMREGHLIERRGFRKLLHTPTAVLAAVVVVTIGGTTVAAASGSFGGSDHPPPTVTGRQVPVASTTARHAGASTGAVVVPDVIGFSQSAASTTLKTARFIPTTGSTQSSATVPKGDVISTVPAAGAKAAKGSTVTMVVSTGPSTAGALTVPDVSGLSERVASATLTHDGFVPTVGSQQSSATVPKGEVISTVPAAGAKAAKGSTVTMVVSAGPSTAGALMVPDVSGLSEGVASATLTHDGFVPMVGSQSCSDAVSSGDVISTVPAAGAKAAKGSTVTMVVSNGSCSP